MMYASFSEDVKKVNALAHEIAKEYEQEYVGTEHLLLAIVRSEAGNGATILRNRGASKEELKVHIDRLIKQSLEETWVFGRLPGTPHYRNVVAGAVEAAQKTDAREIGTEHLLLALLQEEGSVAFRALAELNIHFSDVHQEISGV